MMMPDIPFINEHRVLNSAVSAETSEKALGFPVLKDLSAVLFCLAVLKLTVTHFFYFVIAVLVRFQSLKREEK